MYVSEFASVCDLCEFFPFLVSKNKLTRPIATSLKDLVIVINYSVTGFWAQYGCSKCLIVPFQCALTTYKARSVLSRVSWNHDSTKIASSSNGARQKGTIKDDITL